jgi:FAD/FMN-containing dehydrogenase
MTTATARPTLDFKLSLFAGALFIALLCPCIAAAALGEPESSVQADGALLRGSIKVSDHTNYRLHEIKLPSGTLVREFAGPDGKIFAVAWRGPAAPNLRQTFGRYFDTFAAAAGKTRHRSHSRLELRQKDLVVQSSGHMRAFSGLAYLPQALPTGVDAGDLH